MICGHRCAFVCEKTALGFGATDCPYEPENDDDPASSVTDGPQLNA